MELWHLAILILCATLLLRRLVTNRPVAMESSRVIPLTLVQARGLTEPRTRGENPTPPGNAVRSPIPLTSVKGGRAGNRRADPDPSSERRLAEVQSILEQARQEIHGAKMHASSLLVNAQAEAQAALERAREECRRISSRPAAAPSPDAAGSRVTFLRGREEGRSQGLVSGHKSAIQDVERVFGQLESLVVAGNRTMKGGHL